ncbi:MAG: 3-dehydroquinate synthase [Hespellia sp.]|nr:3-dehydroquinate synthase [Hespellia sp.]
MEMTVNLGEKSYPIYIQNGILKEAKSYIEKKYTGKRIMIISDDNVYPIYGDALTGNLSERYECSHYVVPHGELSKDFQMLPGIYSAMLEAGITRSDLVIALGGGVIGDLAGFAASSYLRGIPFVQIPTSLLAQVDSSVGGKVAVDLPQGKNLVGAFYQPKLVLIDPTVLDTLPEKFINDGMGEVIKYGCIFDQELFETLADAGSFEGLKSRLEEIIYKCVDCKRIVVEEDQFDFGSRMLLNFGHTLAHTIEQHFHYERESHGEAVAIGMYQISRIAEMKGLTKEGTAKKIKEVLERYQLPYSCGLSMNVLLGAIHLDKKNLDGHLNVVLLREIGESYVYQTDTSFFADAEGEV